MIKIDFQEPAIPGWAEWREKCQQATGAVCQQVQGGAKPNISGLYGGQKQVYCDSDGQGVFHGKCAYCESPIASDQPGDIEHFRPKGELTDSENRPVLVDGAHGGNIPHPGYYWLAYDWRNLLPSCTDCNRPSKQKTGGKKRLGKWKQFPVKSFRAAKPGEESQEEPLLINPTQQDPEDHLAIDPATGVFIPKTREGQVCIDVFGLNDREALVEARKRVMDDVTSLLGIMFVHMTHAPDVATTKLQRLLRIKAGHEPYTAAARTALRESPAWGILRQTDALYR